MPTSHGAPKIEYGELLVQQSTTITVSSGNVDYPISHATQVVNGNSYKTTPDGTDGEIKVGRGKWRVRALVRVAAAAGTPNIQLKLYSGADGSTAEVTNSTDQVATSGLLIVERVVDITTNGHMIQFRLSNETDTNNINVTYAFMSVEALDTLPSRSQPA